MKGDWVDWPGWRLLGALAVFTLVVVIFYSGYTLHQHNADLNCMKQGFDQVLNELLHNQHITAPPDC